MNKFIYIEKNRKVNKPQGKKLKSKYSEVTQQKQIYKKWRNNTKKKE